MRRLLVDFFDAHGLTTLTKITKEPEVASLKAEARNKLSSVMIDYDLNFARINIIPAALAEAVKPIEKISDIRIFDTGGLLGRGGGIGAGGASGLGLGDGLASQLLSVSAFKPMIDKILTEAGFAVGPDALSSLTLALAAKQLGDPVAPHAAAADIPPPPTTISGPGKATLGPRS